MAGRRSAPDPGVGDAGEPTRVPTSAEVYEELDTTPLSERDDSQPDQPDEGDLKRADVAADGYIEDAEPEDPPVRAARPDTPVLQSLAVGAGQHKPPNDPLIGADGRVVQSVIQEAADDTPPAS